MKSEGFARAILIYHVNFTMGTVFFSRAHERKRKGKKKHNVMCFKNCISEKFQMFQAALYLPRKLDVRNFTASSLSQFCVSHSKEI